MQYTCVQVTVLLEYIIPQLLTAVEAEQQSSKQLTGHSDRVTIHTLRAVGLISSSGVCESVVSDLLLNVRNVEGKC